MIVVDSSAILEVLLNSSAAGTIAQRLFAPGETLHAPHLIDLEVTQVLRRFCRIGEVDTERGTRALQAMLDLRLTRHPHHIFLPRVWELRNNVSGYDAVYLALAEALGAPLVTRDRALAMAAGHRARVEVL